MMAKEKMVWDGVKENYCLITAFNMMEVLFKIIDMG
jgi:hypothetical protein